MSSISPFAASPPPALVAASNYRCSCCRNFITVQTDGGTISCSDCNGGFHEEAARHLALPLCSRCRRPCLTCVSDHLKRSTTKGSDFDKVEVSREDDLKNDFLRLMGAKEAERFELDKELARREGRNLVNVISDSEDDEIDAKLR